MCDYKCNCVSHGGVFCPAIISELEHEVRRCAILVASRHRGGGGAGRHAPGVALQLRVVVGLTGSRYLAVKVVCPEVGGCCRTLRCGSGGAEFGLGSGIRSRRSVDRFSELSLASRSAAVPGEKACLRLGISGWIMCTPAGFNPSPTAKNRILQERQE